MNTLISQSALWSSLQIHQQSLANTHMRDLFAQDNQRFQRFSLEACGLLLDYSKNRLTGDTLSLLLQLAKEVDLRGWIDRMYRGEKINNTENRAVLHIALRNRSNHPILVDGQDVMPEVNAVLAKIREFSDKVRNEQWRGYTGKVIDTIVNIGIGGSDLGPAMISRALKAYHHPRLKAYFVSNADSTHLVEVLKEVNPETTLFIIESKTFTTQETMLNARSARQWLIDKLGNEQAIAKHFVAVSTAKEKVTQFGIDTANMFGFWDWVGGRYSLWSAIGLPVAIMVGMDNFEKLLAGAHDMDKHFQTAPFDKNMPTILALIAIWYSNFFHAPTHTVLPYDFALELLPAYLQQLVMESLGKRVTRDGRRIDYTTCPITWGAAGNNGQHAFYQLLHQGTQMVPADVIIAITSQQPLPGHQDAVISNALAQTHVFMKGRNTQETEAALASSGIPLDQVAHREFPGNQPSNTVVYQTLTPEILGALIALYEHKTFVQSVCWGLNAFDQWGVELGKQVANSLLPELSKAEATTGYDDSTNGLLNYIKARR